MTILRKNYNCRFSIFSFIHWRNTICIFYYVYVSVNNRGKKYHAFEVNINMAQNSKLKLSKFSLLVDSLSAFSVVSKICLK